MQASTYQSPRHSWSPFAVQLFAVLFSPIFYQSLKRISSSWTNPQSEQLAENMTTATNNTSDRLPTYFLGIGRPNFIENTNHPAYLKLIETGKEITTKVKPKAVVVFSAHWQEGPSSIHVNSVEDAGLIYDFYGFPSHYYEIKYPYKGKSRSGRESRSEARGSFDPIKEEPTQPSRRPSLLVSTNEDQRPALSNGQSSRKSPRGHSATPCLLFSLEALIEHSNFSGYTSTFDDALKEATSADPKEDRRTTMAALTNRPDARMAHPSLEHIPPIYAVAGAAGSDVGERLWTMPEGSLNWSQYRFGNEVRSTKSSERHAEVAIHALDFSVPPR
ncbi:putative aromatic ring-opening dioxygenase LigB subunit [Poronia punctata]|nr:putative aromatic ring-opening dioxygenase LigB subunit [Poronia punctata]